MRALTVDDVQRTALSALNRIQGVSSPDDNDLPQFHVEITVGEPDDGSCATVTVAFSEAIGPFRGHPQHFKIIVSVERVTADS